MAKDILKEAIADAKAVREVALANAKAALEEAFTPKLQSMLSAKLSEDLDEDYYEEDMESEGMMTYEDDEENLEMGETYEMGEEDSMDEEINLEDILNELELEEDEEDDIEEAVGYPNYRADQLQKVKHDADDINQGLNENFDLDSLLKEINDLEEEEEILEVEDDEIALNEQGCGPGMVMNNEGHCMEGHGMMNTGHNMMNAGYGMMNAGHNIASSMEDPYDDMMEDDMEELDMMEAEMMGMEEMDMYIPDMMETKSGGCGCAKENLQNQETKKAYNAVRSELNEVNLLNSKLLYVNRIFKANNLSESQKLRVVETLDKAGSVKEAKLIYETVKDTFTISKKKKTTPKKSIRENFGMASKATLTSAPRKSVLNESNDMVARMQKLANISKIK